MADRGLDDVPSPEEPADACGPSPGDSTMTSLCATNADSLSLCCRRWRRLPPGGLTVRPNTVARDLRGPLDRTPGRVGSFFPPLCGCRRRLRMIGDQQSPNSEFGSSREGHSMTPRLAASCGRQPRSTALTALLGTGLRDRHHDQRAPTADGTVEPAPVSCRQPRPATPGLVPGPPAGTVTRVGLRRATLDSAATSQVLTSPQRCPPGADYVVLRHDRRPALVCSDGAWRRPRRPRAGAGPPHRAGRWRASRPTWPIPAVGRR